MPITNKPLPNTGEGQTPAIDTCLNCNGSVVPCACHGGCNFPFKGLIHVSNASHLCHPKAVNINRGYASHAERADAS